MMGKTKSFRRKPPQRAASVGGEGSAAPPSLLPRNNSGHVGKVCRPKSGSVRSILRTTSSDSGDSRWSSRSSDDSILEDEGEAFLPASATNKGKKPHNPSFRRSRGSSFRSTYSPNSFRRKEDDCISPGSHKLMLLLASLVVALCCVASVVIQSYFLLGLKQRGVETPITAPTSMSVLPHRDDTNPDLNNPRPNATGNPSALVAELSLDPPIQHTVVRKQDQEPRNNKPPQSDRDRLEQYIVEHGTASIRKVITAYTEGPLQDTVPGTGSRENPDNVNYGVAPEFVLPLPLRTQTPAELQRHMYPKAKTCHDLPALFPVDRGIVRDESGESMQWNLGNEPTAPDFPEEEAKFCPVELDPFLPWIHDMITSLDGTYIEFIAQNRRRCRTGKRQTDSVHRLVPQVALLQGISVKRIDETEAMELAPTLWTDPNATKSPRYRLAAEEDAETDGQQTRFICRFSQVRLNEEHVIPETTVIGETLSVYPFLYEMVTYRKGTQTMLTPRGNDGGFFWTSTLRFRCPVPSSLRNAVAQGITTLSDGTATLHVDVVPIRTSVRYDEKYLPTGAIKPNPKLKLFDPAVRWGHQNVLPRIEASGRWQNLPVCPPPQPGGPTPENGDVVKKKKHFLSACLWASAEFRTRGEHRAVNSDTTQRIMEWIEFHLMVGFDHIYVYDNSGAHTNETSLEPVLDAFGASVTRIDWPSTVCNNNKPAADSAGERSSQYAAEASCLARYGPHSEWLASFDTDEYFVPMGNYTNMKDVLVDATSRGTNILSLRSSRGKLRFDMTEPKDDSLVKTPSSLFLEAYNCDGPGSPKPDWADRARKQIYRSDYVLHHFVHYSTVTQNSIRTYKEAQEANEKWLQRFTDVAPVQVNTDELHEAVMVHTKSVSVESARPWKSRCHHENLKKWNTCFIGFQWTNMTTHTNETYNSEGFNYNCFINPTVETVWIPKLRAAIAARQEFTGTTQLAAASSKRGADAP